MNLASTVVRGLGFLRASQSPSGFWSDWQLPLGESRMWTTAYIGYRLSSLSPHRRLAVEDTLSDAARWLRASELPGGGWGYSEQAGPDADSTALSLLFLLARGSPITTQSCQRIRQHQRDDGGFATYTPDVSFGAWVESHPEVSAVSLLALLRALAASTEDLNRGIRYLRERRRRDGLWNSFWWTTCLYSTEAALTLLDVAGEPLEGLRLKVPLHDVPAPTPFASALRLLCLVRVGGAGELFAAQHARTLAEEQLADGSWPSGPILRLTGRDVREPWLVDDAGPLFADERRLFTTATVVAALDAFERRQWNSGQ